MKNTQNENKKFWLDRLNNDKFDEINVTMSDHQKRIIENEVVINNLMKFHHDEQSKLLDIGCGTGWSTKIYNKYFKGKCYGLDYEQKFIDIANDKFNDINKRIEYIQGDVLNLSSTLNEKFDFIISQRCLINLENFEKQKEALKNIYDILKNNGVLILLESRVDSRYNLSYEREYLGLNKLDEIQFNVDFDVKDTLDYLTGDLKFSTYQILNTGFYDLIHKIIYPLSIYPNEPDFNSNVNAYARKIQLFLNLCEVKNFEEYSKSLIIILEK